jgi:hypothetical protein
MNSVLTTARLARTVVPGLPFEQTQMSSAVALSKA